MPTLQSMTGFGRGSAEEAGILVTCEARSVNHRFLDLAVRLPGPLLALETRMTARVRESFERGRLDITFRRRGTGASTLTVVVDPAAARAWRDAMLALGDSLGIVGGVELASIADRPGVMTVEERSDLDAEGALCEAALEQALEGVREHRTREGIRLAEDLRGRCRTLENLLQEVEEHVSEAVSRHVSQIREKVTSLLANHPLDESRLLQEAALLADKADIHEEIQRFRGHLQEVEKTVAQGGGAGRRLDFLAQELHREVNTMSSKAQELRARRLIVDMKSEVEKVREQAQNVE